MKCNLDCFATLHLYHGGRLEVHPVHRLLGVAVVHVRVHGVVGPGEGGRGTGAATELLEILIAHSSKMTLVQPGP